jgi:glycosyltransferase involved in cell wall biosynthesis
MRTEASLRVAIVHEWFVNVRGSEKVLIELADLFPDAVLFVSVLDRAALPSSLAGRDIRQTFVGALPKATTRYQMYLPLMPLAYRLLNLSAFDLVITSSHACANHVRTHRSTPLISYTYTPMRYAWSGYDEYRASIRSPLGRFAMALLMRYMRLVDLRAAMSVDHFVAISSAVQARIKRYYGRESHVIFPPVRRPQAEDRRSPTDLIPALDGEPYLLSLGRVTPYKRVDLAVDACSQAGLRLVVAGSGSELARLRDRAADCVHFLPTFTDGEAAILYQGCAAFIFPGEEDFGLTIVEAQAYGRPVVAYAQGGARDIVVDMETGVLFSDQTVPCLQQAIRKALSGDWDAEKIRGRAALFSPERFRCAILTLIHSVLEGEFGD